MLHSKSVPNLKEETPVKEENFAYLDPDKRLRVTDNTLKLIQKQVLLDYYERLNSSSGGSKKGTKDANSRSDPDSGFYSPTETKTEALVHRTAAEEEEELDKELQECMRGAEDEEEQVRERDKAIIAVAATVPFLSINERSKKVPNHGPNRVFTLGFKN